MYCPLGNHLLRGSGLFITNPRHISFIHKIFPDFLLSEKVCAKCKKDIEVAYEYKMKRALKLRGRNGSLISSHTSDESSVVGNRNNERTTNARNVQKDLVAASSTSTDDDGQPTTSAQAAAKRQRKEEHQKSVQPQNLLAINVQRGARLPHIQPVPRRHQFVHANPDIMDIYAMGMTGG